MRLPTDTLTFRANRHNITLHKSCQKVKALIISLSNRNGVYDIVHTVRFFRTLFRFSPQHIEQSGAEIGICEHAAESACHSVVITLLARILIHAL